jgi:hypothetical protein
MEIFALLILLCTPNKASACGPPSSSATIVRTTYFAFRGDGSSDCPAVDAVYYGQGSINPLTGALVISALTNLGGTVISSPIVRANPSTGEVRFFALGTDHALWTRTTTAGWVDLGGYCLVLPDTPNGHNQAKAGFDVEFFSGDYRIVVIGGDHAVYYRTLGGGPNAYTDFGGYATSSPTVNTPLDSNGVPTMDFFVLGGEGGSWLRSLSTPWTRSYTYECSPSGIGPVGSLGAIYVSLDGSAVQSNRYQHRYVSATSSTITYVNSNIDGRHTVEDLTITSGMLSGASSGTAVVKTSPLGLPSSSVCTKQGN